MPTTGKLGLDEGTTSNLATNTLTEDAVTKHIPRSVLNTSAGVETGTASTPLRTDPTGSTTQPVSAASLPLPTGASTAANQATGNSSLSSIDGKIPAQGQALAAGSIPVVLPAAQITSLAPLSTVTANLGTIGGAATSAKQDTGNTSVGNVDTNLGAIADAQVTAGATGSLHAKVRRLSTDIDAVKTSVASIDGKVTAANTRAVTVASSALPTGAATGAKQDTGNTSLGSIDGKLVTQITSDYDTGAGTQAMPLSGIALPASGGAVAGGTSTNPLRTDPTGSTTQPVSAASLPLPAGASTAANQTTGNTSLASIDGKVPALGQALAAGSVPVVLTASQLSTITPPAAITGFATSAKQDTGNTSVASIDTKTPALGQALAAASVPVVLTASQLSTITPPAAITGFATAVKQPALGTAGSASSDVISVQGIASMTPLKTDGSAVTQPVSAASLPLPSGASTSAKQPALGTAGTPSADVITVQGTASMTALKVDGSTVTQPVSIAGNQAVNNVQVNGTVIDTNSGNKSAGTQRVILATDQPAFTNAMPVTQKAATSTSGTLQSAASATANGSTLSVDGMSAVVFTVSGTYVGTITFEGTEDGTNYTSLMTTQVGTSTIGTSTTSTGTFEASVAGLTLVRARLTWTSGTSVTVTAHAVPVNFSTRSVIAGGNVASGATDSGNPVKVGGVYSSTQPTLTDGQRGNFQVNNRGELLIATSQGGVAVQQTTASAFNAQVVGNVASGATDSGNPVKVGGVYNSTTPTLTNGQRGDAQVGTRGAAHVNLIDTNGTTGSTVIGAQSDSLSNSNPGLVVYSYNSVYDGSTWERVRSASSVADAQSLSATPATAGMMYNGTNWDRMRGDTTSGLWVNVKAALPTGSNVIGALSANQTVNNAQINGVTPLMGNGVTGTGSQRVTVASDNTPFQVSASNETGTVFNGTTALTPKFAKIVASSSGATTIVAAVTSKKIRVLSYVLTSNGTVNVKWQSHVTPTDLTGLDYLVANTGVSCAYSPVGHFETTAGEALDINLSGAVAVGGHLTYIEV